ncbi:Uncharacterized protein APZ42_007252 [Daphnia magna]|uniref:Uncharacterized protein n=1 Tax=Daphnia magna TaxID=35525 RepID=A0A164FEK1_9CRUS|nr:Uncharacterized protein APZ42_007252 [Daphnia magna]
MHCHLHLHDNYGNRFRNDKKIYFSISSCLTRSHLALEVVQFLSAAPQSYTVKKKTVEKICSLC